MRFRAAVGGLSACRTAIRRRKYEKGGGLLAAFAALCATFAGGDAHHDGVTTNSRVVHSLYRNNELRSWSVNRYIKCLFCMEYDDYDHLSVFGCNAADLSTCYGNACYMRQHKDNKFFLYTSGCLNITEKDYAEIRDRTTNVKPARGNSGNETQLCEVTLTINTCLCTNRPSCNNISSVEPFSEFTQFVFKDINFDEVAHFRHFLPHDPILKDPSAAIMKHSGKNAIDQYVLFSRSAAPDALSSLYFAHGRITVTPIAWLLAIISHLISFSHYS